MKTIPPLLLYFLFLLAAPPIGAETRLFVIGSIGTPDLPVDRAGLYIAPASDPEMIEAFRRSIRVWRQGGIEAIIAEDVPTRVHANAERVGDGLNRDYSLPGAPAWNWHVTNVNELIGNGFLLDCLDGNPVGMEAGASGCYNSTIDALQICFWNYGPIGELPFSYEPDQAGGRKTSWIGDFWDEEYPWIYHQRLGWLYVTGFDPNHVWVWSYAGQRWIWLREGWFPWIWDHTDSAWKYYVRFGATNWFYNATTGEWEPGL